MKKISWLLCAVVVALLGLAIIGYAAPNDGEGAAKDLTADAVFSYEKDDWFDDNYESYASIEGGKTIEIETQEVIAGIYLRYDKIPTGELTITAGESEVTLAPDFLHKYIDLGALFGELPREVSLTWSEKTVIADLFVLGKGALPDYVQVWEEMCDEADLLLAPTHADDDQLFFLGILPYYAGELGYEVQVVYFTNHNNVHDRPHELLNGLWTVGVTRYPLIAEMKDAWNGETKTLEYGYRKFEEAGWSKQELVDFWVQTIRRFKPQVIVGHDVNGEYGHPQHMVNTDTLREALLVSGSAEYVIEDSDLAPYTPEKVYLHLWEEDKITMDWDKPLEAFGGKTGYEVSRLGYACHESQQWTWFTRWIKGNNGEFTSATQIGTYSPCEYGLYFTSVGKDTVGGDFFEHVTVRSQIPPETEPPVTQPPVTEPPATDPPQTESPETQGQTTVSPETPPVETSGVLSDVPADPGVSETSEPSPVDGEKMLLLALFGGMFLIGGALILSGIMTKVRK